LVTFDPVPVPDTPVACLTDGELPPPAVPLLDPPPVMVLPVEPVTALLDVTAAPVNCPAWDVPPTFGWPWLLEAYIALLVPADV
jgi:hypothetical protein